MNAGQQAFDLAAGKDRRDTGQALALAVVADAWRGGAEYWVHALPPGTLFTADDLVREVGLPHGATKVNGNNAVGALFASLARRQPPVIRNTHTYQQSQRTHNRARVLAVWQRLYG